MSDIKPCQYCEESKFEKLKAIKIIYQWENPEAHGYPEIAYWNRTYDIVRCPICGRKISKIKD